MQIINDENDVKVGMFIKFATKKESLIYLYLGKIKIDLKETRSSWFVVQFSVFNYVGTQTDFNLDLSYNKRYYTIESL